jgi:hypothetical protein
LEDLGRFRGFSAKHAFGRFRPEENASIYARVAKFADPSPVRTRSFSVSPKLGVRGLYLRQADAGSGALDLDDTPEIDNDDNRDNGDNVVGVCMMRPGGSPCR